MDCPRITIITITYNAEATLERTIESVERQDYTNIEYIVVDGKSTDGTMSIVERHAGRVDRWVSEPDGGLYYAMNKGLAMASGEYVWFVNAGDEVAEPDTISRMMATEPDADIYYGDTVMTDMEGKVIGGRRLVPPDELTWKSFKNGMLVSHQSFVVRKEICGEYDTRYRFSADFDWCVRAMKKSRKRVNTRMTLSRFLDGGITKHNIAAGLKERFGIMVRHYGIVSTVCHHVLIAIKFFYFWATRGRF